MAEETTSLYGVVERFLFQSSENGFAVAIVISASQAQITVKGFLPNLQAGQQVNLTGNWIFHPKFGKQFAVTSYQITLPTSAIGLKKYLGSGLIKGIGANYAEKLVNHFGTKIIEVIEQTPERLAEVEGIGPKRIEQIQASWKSQKEISNIMIFLQDKGISSAYATKIYKQYGQNSIAVLQENPYRLADEIWGIGFKMADQIAQKLGIPPDSPKRMKSAVSYAINQVVGAGHLYAELNQLKAQVFEILELDPIDYAPLLKAVLHELHQIETIKVVKEHDQHFVTLTQFLFTEKAIAKKVQLLLNSPVIHDFNYQKIYQGLKTGNTEIQLNEQQQLAVMTILKQKFCIVTGGPGTGKTTLVKQLLATLDQHKLQYKLAAPTGRAAKRMAEGTGRFASTIHRLLEFDVSTMRFTHNENNCLKTQFLILDEASMIDTFLMNSILKALSIGTHLILIGDVDQLPSVGAGNILNDLIQSHRVPYTKLTEIFRQAQDSLIIINAHRVNQGEFPSAKPVEGGKRDFYFINEADPINLPVHLTKIFKATLPKYGIFPSQAVVLSPMHRGNAGTQKLNFDLQNLLNSQTEGPNLSHHGYKYQVGDRIMQLRNNYDKHVFNGDLGYITEIDPAKRTMICKFDFLEVEYEYNELDEITLAYAISIHKSQGSEYEAVIIPIFTQHFTLLQRNLIYTAITRAKKLCILIGQTRAIAMAVKNNKTTERKTFLKQLLNGEIHVI